MEQKKDNSAHQKDYTNIDIFAHRAYPLLHKIMCELYLEKNYNYLQIINKNLDRIYKDYSLFNSVLGALPHIARADKVVVERLVSRQYNYYREYLQKYPHRTGRALIYYNKCLYRETMNKIHNRKEKIDKILVREHQAFRMYSRIKKSHPNSPLLQQNGGVFEIIANNIARLMVDKTKDLPIENPNQSKV